MISNWNAFVSYGLPVGLAGPRIIAEATINDLDKALLGAGRKYCRYSDDIRIFCKSEADATLALEQLASHLFNTHGLTLQPLKTLILKKHDYLRRFTLSGERAEIESFGAKLQELLEAAGWADEYEEEIDYDALPEETQEEVDKLNLLEVLNRLGGSISRVFEGHQCNVSSEDWKACATESKEGSNQLLRKNVFVKPIYEGRRI